MMMSPDRLRYTYAMTWLQLHPMFPDIAIESEMAVVMGYRSAGEQFDALLGGSVESGDESSFMNWGRWQSTRCRRWFRESW